MSATDPPEESDAPQPADRPIQASYESTGGTGVDLEADVVSQLLGALLAQETDRLLPPGSRALAVRVQRREGPRGFDDIAVHASSADGAAVPAYVQVKASFSLTAAGGEFGAYVKSLEARDVAQPDAPWTATLVAADLTPPIIEIDALIQWAKTADSADDFAAKCAAPRVLNADKRRVLAAVGDHVAGDRASSTWRVLRRLRVAEVDYGLEASPDAEALRRRLDALLEGGAASGEDLRDALRSRVLQQSRFAPTYTRDSLLAELGGRFAFKAAPRLAPELERLDAEGALALASFAMNLGPVSLLRPEAFDAAQARADTGRPLRITGAAGCGKSMILARLAFATPRRIVIKDDRASGRTWSEYARTLGVSLSAETVVAALGERPALLAIDGADRLLMSERRAIVLDLFRALAASPTRDNWRITTTGRDAQGRDLVRAALLEAGLDAGQRLDVDGLDDDDVAVLAVAIPELRTTLARTDVGGRNRDLFSLREALHDPELHAVGSEVGMSARWATRGQRQTPATPERDAAIGQIGEALLAAPSTAPGRAGLDPRGVDALIQEGTLRASPHRDGLAFAHDVYEDWALARALDRRRREIPDLLRAADQPLWWLRAVRLAGAIAVEASGPTAWLDLVDACAAATDLDPVWWRTILIAPLYSERAPDLLVSAHPILLADDARVLEQLVDTLLVLETRLDEALFEQIDGTLEERHRVAAHFPVPRFRSWLSFLRFVARSWADWPPRLIPKFARLVQIWLRLSEGSAHPLGKQLVAIAQTCVEEIENAIELTTWEDRRDPFGCDGPEARAWEETARQLRQAMAYGVASNRTAVETYLKRLAADRKLRSCADDLLRTPREIPAFLPGAWADLCIARFAPRRPRRRGQGRALSGPFLSAGFNDGGLESLSRAAASPKYAGFDLLFAADPTHALRMLRRFEKRASVFYRHYARRHDGRRPRPVRIRFPWGETPLWGDENTYRWGRGALGPDTLGSAYMALDLWMAREAAGGRPIDDLFRLVLRPHGLNASLVPCINVAVEHINTPGQLDAVGPILGEPRVWSFEARRYSDDITQARQPIIPYFAVAHREAILEVGARYARRQHLRADLPLPFMLLASGAAKQALFDRAAAWSAEDMASFDDELANPQQVAAFQTQVDRYRVDIDPANLELKEQEGQLVVSINPPAPLASELAELEAERARYNAAMRLMLWGIKGVEARALQDGIGLEAAIALAQAVDPAGLFQDLGHENIVGYFNAQGVAATAALAARLADDDLFGRHADWIMQTLVAAARVTRREMFDIDDAIMSGDPAVSAAWGLAALPARGVDRHATARELLLLATDRHHHVAAAVVAGVDYADGFAMAWALTKAAFAGCQFHRGKTYWEPDSADIRRDRLRRRKAAYRHGQLEVRAGWRSPIAKPPPAFQDAWARTRSWRKPFVRVLRPHPILFDWGRVKILLEALPLASLTEDLRAARNLQRYLKQVVAWARAFSEDGPEGAYDQHYPYELMGVVATTSGRLAALLASVRRDDDAWRVLTTFEDRDHDVDLVGQFLGGMAETLIESGAAPTDAFWRAWDPPARWVMGEPGTRVRGARHASEGLTTPISAAGFLGPYGSPIPPSWPHVEALLPRINSWVERTDGIAGAARALLRFCDRLSQAQVEQYALVWIEGWLERHGDDFWEQAELPNHAAAVVLRLHNADGPAPSNALQRRIRQALARLADRGALSARDAMARVAAERPDSAS